MTNELTKLTDTAELTEAQSLILDELEHEDHAYDTQAPRLKIGSGGVNAFVTTDGETYKELDCIIALSRKARAYWPESGTGSPPMCASYDGITGYLTGEVTDEQFKAATQARVPHAAIQLIDGGSDLPNSFPCIKCPLNQWGSEHQRRGENGRGKACRELRRLVLIMDDFGVPVLLSLPPTSIRSFDQYASGLQSRKSAYFGVRTKISLREEKSSRGETYNVAEFAIAGTIEDVSKLQAVIALRKEAESLLSNMEITSAEYDTRPTSKEESEEEIPF